MIIKGGVETEEKGNKGEAQNKMAHFHIYYVDFAKLPFYRRETKRGAREESGGGFTDWLWNSGGKVPSFEMTENSQI